MQKWFVQELLDVPSLPAGLRASACIATDATSKGHRNNLWNFRRSGLSTTELSECYKTSYTDAGIPQSKLASKSLVNKFVHSERDASLTGAMIDDNASYAFFHWCIGHVSPTSEVLSLRKGAEVGFPKRFHLVFKSSKPASIPEQDCASSKQLIADFAAFLADNVTKQDADGAGVTVTCDDFAAGWMRRAGRRKEYNILMRGAPWGQITRGRGGRSVGTQTRTCLRHIQQCIEDFQTTRGNLKEALLASAPPPCPLAPRPAQDLRRTPTACTMYAQRTGCHECRRGHPSIPVDQRGSEGIAASSERCWRRAASRCRRNPAFSLCMKWVLQSTPSTDAVQDSTEVRKKIQGRLSALCERRQEKKDIGRKKKQDGPANTLLQAVRDLSSKSVVELTEAKGSGHATLKFRKRKWSEITDNAHAMGLCKALRVGMEHFPPG